jgi:hypothetical protein
MKFVIANLLVVFCFIGYVEAQPTGDYINGIFVKYDDPAYERLEAAEEARILQQAKARRNPVPEPTPTSNPNNSYSRAAVRKREDEIDPEVIFDIVPLDQDPAIKKEVKKQKQPSPKAIAPKQNYRYSFSGADCNVFAKTYKGDLIHLDSVSTVSVSIYEAKAPVRRLGHASPVGFTGNIRTVAGSIICVLRDNHPLSEMMQGNFHTKHLDDNQIRDNVKGNFNSGALFPFDLMLMYKNEVGDALGFSIYNVEIISEGIVTSTNDMITEVVLQFQATHIDQIEKVKPIKAPEPKPVKVVPEVKTPEPKSENLKVFYEFVLHGSLTTYNEIQHTFVTTDISRDEVVLDEHGNTAGFNNLISKVQIGFGFGEYNLYSNFSTVKNNSTRLNKNNFITLRDDYSIKEELIESINDNNLLPLNKKQVSSLINNYSITFDTNNTEQSQDLDLEVLLLNGTTSNIDYTYQDLESEEARTNEDYSEELLATVPVTITRVELKLELVED